MGAAAAPPSARVDSVTRAAPPNELVGGDAPFAHAFDPAASRGGTADTPSAAASASDTWVAIGEVAHTYTVKEFERQVYARLAPTFAAAQRLPFYTARAPAGGAPIDSYHRQFQQQVRPPPNLHWKDSEQGGKGATTPGTPVECDLYVRLGEGANVQTLFEGCAEDQVSVTGHGQWSSLATSATKSVILCEVAETPESIRAKLWQLERAMICGPESLRSPVACVVCINGERSRFRVFAEAASRALTGAPFALCHVPVFAIWTPYRNVYAELTRVNVRLDGVESRLRGVESRLDGVESRLGGIESSLASVLRLLEANSNRNP